ncbi:mismatch-specific DNA-glycosylase [Rhodobacter ferrooxidans]|uniref:Uracil-DNA glycosylase superfamily n=1 Tax=Rhodobacter ferrooxidans TaxID=371731 RepID=C8RZ13_9RHOB|nr:mismatch-specific DNA-glycosylase [Rhodobacter sp. SW2]EEW25970.1 Uracil-DNA glycosylase superfamily [Rhodobacter sp. SW2]
MLPDIVAPGLDVLFCGTAPGAMSAARGHYYARPGNRFWPLLAEIGLTPRRLHPDEDHLLPGFGLGLTDLAQGVSGQDAEIPRHAYAPDRLQALVAAIRPRALAFTSLTAARLALGVPRLAAGALPADPRYGHTRLWALPSPSGLARSHFSADPWLALAAWRKGLR